MKRNEKKIDEIRQRIAALNKAMEEEQDLADQIEDGAEWEIADKAIFDKYQPVIDKLYALMDSLEYPHCRHGWFSDTFCESFKTGTTSISEKQYEIFYQHAARLRYDDHPKCVVNGRLFIICHGGIGHRPFVEVEEIPEFDNL